MSAETVPVQASVRRPLRAKLIFNMTSGQHQESLQQLSSILIEMQRHHILPEVYLLQPESDIEAVVRSTIKRGIRLIVVAGGDGTIDLVAQHMVGSSARLGIVPTGTRNNIAYNLGIPTSIADAVALLRSGKQLKVDIGHLQSGSLKTWFFEAASLGLITDLYLPADDIQHGDLGQIGNLLSTFVSSTPSQLRMLLDTDQHVDMSAYMVLIANMPYIGPRFQISPHVSWNDGLLDVFVFQR